MHAYTKTTCIASNAAFNKRIVIMRSNCSIYIIIDMIVFLNPLLYNIHVHVQFINQ